MGKKSSPSVVILAIESSCDDTSIAVLRDGEVLSNIVSSQIAHKDLGGVIPELASRKHLEKIDYVMDAALSESGLSLKDLTAIGVTAGPGLLGSLLVGLSYAKGLSLQLDIPLVEVNHMHAHILAHFIDDPKPSFPFLCLTVSGGHTQIVKISSVSEMEILGETRDDAAGEAFDKIGKMLGLDYPSGPQVDKLAQEGQAIYDFPISNIPAYDYSFSGLKTAVKYFLRDEIKKDKSFIAKHLKDICASVQAIIVKTLMQKLISASEDSGILEVGIAGGVSANSGLRQALKVTAVERSWNAYIPQISYTTDNAAMVAISAYYKYLGSQYADLSLTPFTRGF